MSNERAFLLAPYLAYGVDVCTYNEIGGWYTVCEYQGDFKWNYRTWTKPGGLSFQEVFTNHQLKPILRPVEDMSQEEINNVYPEKAQWAENGEYMSLAEAMSAGLLYVWQVNKLREIGIDIDNLIPRGLAVDRNTLQQPAKPESHE